MHTPLKLGMVDDNVLLRNGIKGLLTSLGYQVMFAADNGKDLMTKIGKNDLPEIVLMDVNMPEMNGFESTAWITQNFPSVHVIALSMSDSETSITRMFKNGAKGYLLKDATPQEFHNAFQQVLEGGFYFHDKSHRKALVPERGDSEDPLEILDEKEMHLLKMICSEMSWKEIARSLDANAYAIDDSRDALFEKLHVSSRVGLVIYAIKNQLI
jgi:DNA-binding NarL/FixJ family response regulator